jgi:hypothetical protein
LKFSQGEVHDFSAEVQKFSGEVQNNLREGGHLPTPPLKIRPWIIKILNVRYIIIYKQILELETKTKIAQSFTHRILKGLNTSQNSIPVSNYRSAIILMPYNPQQFSLTREDLED